MSRWRSSSTQWPETPRAGLALLVHLARIALLAGGLGLGELVVLGRVDGALGFLGRSVDLALLDEFLRALVVVARADIAAFALHPALIDPALVVGHGRLPCCPSKNARKRPGLRLLADQARLLVIGAHAGMNQVLLRNARHRVGGRRLGKRRCGLFLRRMQGLGETKRDRLVEPRPCHDETPRADRCDRLAL